jgi:hypothetical protein
MASSDPQPGRLCRTDAPGPQPDATFTRFFSHIGAADSTGRVSDQYKTVPELIERRTSGRTRAPVSAGQSKGSPT